MDVQNLIFIDVFLSCAVPRALEAQLTINDKEFEEALSNPDSPQFKELAKTLEDEVRSENNN